jgi:hypothetical protein
MVPEPIVGPWQFFSSVGPLGRAIVLTQGRCLTHRHPSLEWDSNPRSQCFRARSQFIPQTQRLLWSATLKIYLWKFYIIFHFTLSSFASRPPCVCFYLITLKNMSPGIQRGKSCQGEDWTHERLRNPYYRHIVRHLTQFSAYYPLLGCECG